MTGLTESQKKVYDYIHGYIEAKHYSPSYREIASGCGYRTASGVVRVIDQLVDRGWITRDPKKYRTLGVVKNGLQGGKNA
jgi:SOS-response transcriptional repressor LexA